MAIRLATAADHRTLYAICLQTGDLGQDATAQYADPDLVGHVYLGAYLALNPELAFVLEDDEGIAGYIVGTLDTKAFEATAEAEWWPQFRTDGNGHGLDSEAPSTDAALLRHIEHPELTSTEITAAFPSHLHINQLPRTRGLGHGRRLIATLIAALQERGSTGVHLGVGAQNTAARAFYAKIGFAELPQSTEQTRWLAMTLTPTDVGRR